MNNNYESVKLRSVPNEIARDGDKMHDSKSDILRLGALGKTKLALFFVLSFSIFQYFPVLYLTREIWVVFVFAYVILFVIVKQCISRGLIYNSFEFYVFMLILIMPLYSAVMASIEFGQPVGIGILAQRSLVSAGASLILIYWVRDKKVTLSDVEKILPILGWLSLALYVSMVLFINASQYGHVPGFVGGGITEAHHFVFNDTFIIFAIFYYLIRGLNRQSMLDYMFMFPFIIYLVMIDGGRTLMASVFLVMVLVIIKRASLFKMVLWSPIISFFMVIVVSLAMYFQGDYIEVLENKYQAALSVVLTGEKSDDASANARIDEIGLAWPYIEKNWLFGSGDLSHQWEGGYFAKIGYFAPSDIGLIGALYMFGAIGVLIFLMQFIFALSFLKRSSSQSAFVLVNSVAAFLLYYFIHSIFTGAYIYSANVSIVFISILYAASMSSNDSAENSDKVV